MLVITWEALDALSHQFELCGIGPSSRVVALLEDGPLADLARAALARSRAEVLDVRSVHRPGEYDASLASSPLLRAVLAAADVVVDALAEPVTLDPIALDLGADVRTIRLAPNAVDADRWPPHANLNQRVQRAADRLGSAEVIALRDRHGSNLEIRTNGALTVADGGRASAAGELATYPGGWVGMIPAAARVDGELVLMPGDANLARGAHIDAPVRLEIQNDLITTIDGDHASADVLRALLEHFDRDDAYGFATITLGLNPGRPRERPLFEAELLDPVVARILAGVVTIGFGENLHADRPCPGTVGLALPGRTLFADETILAVDGALTGDLAPDVYEAPA